MPDWDVCPNCLEKIIQVYTCTSCGKAVKGNWKICPSCKTPTGNTATTDNRKRLTITRETPAYTSQTNVSAIAPQPSVNYVELAENDLVAGRYFVKKKIGEGGFGRVYEVFDQLIEKPIALKILPYITKDSINNILLEFESRDRLNNTEHIIKAYQPQLTNYKEQSIIIYPMEIAEKSMRDWLNETKRFADARLEEGIGIFIQACMGVEAIHQAGLIHLDLKPENILLTQNKKSKDLSTKWIVKISDFGLARGIGLENLEILRDGIGTPAYMAPEQIIAARWKDVGMEADIYSLGMILYELIDGDLPYSGSSKQIKEKKLNPQIPITPLQAKGDLSHYAMKCLEREKNRRVKTVSDLIYALDERRRIEVEQRIKKKKADEFLSEAKRLVDIKRFDEAKEICKQALRLENDDVHFDKWKKVIENIDKLKKFEIDKAKKGEMILVKGGVFEMGSREFDDEKPIHSVELKSFLIDKYQVTVKQYREFCKTTSRNMPRTPVWGWFEDHPVVNVSWQDAYHYAKWVDKRLPTEAEWEYAARGGKDSKNFKYSGSDNIDEVAWYVGNSKSKTNPVGKKAPNELGIHDMSGNVLEWCSDWYSAYPSSSQNNPTGPVAGQLKVIRGGSWNLKETACRNTLRNSYDPGIRDEYFGFRCVKDL